MDRTLGLNLVIVRRRKKTLFDLCIMSRNEKRVLFFFPANYGMHVTISSRVLPSEHCTPHTTHARDRSETYLASARRAWRADGLAAPAHRAYRWLQTHGAYQAARASRSARRLLSIVCYPGWWLLVLPTHEPHRSRLR